MLSDDELKALVAAAKADPDAFAARRDEALIRLLLDSRARISELAGIRLDESDVDAGTAWVLGKAAADE